MKLDHEIINSHYLTELSKSEFKVKSQLLAIYAAY
jgi:hypothetical protein